MAVSLTLEDLHRLANEISALDIEEKDQVHVGSMLACADDLEVAVLWVDSDVVQVTKKEMYFMAAVIAKIAPDSPDNKFAKRILSRKAGSDEWKHYALRAEDELYLLRDCIDKVVQHGSSFDVMKLMLQPWQDVALWDCPLESKGYGVGYVIESEMNNDLVVVLSQKKEDVVKTLLVDGDLKQHAGKASGKLAVNGTVEDSEYEEELEMVDVDPNALSDDDQGMENVLDTMHNLQHSLSTSAMERQTNTTTTVLESSMGEKPAGGITPPILKPVSTSTPLAMDMDVAQQKVNATEQPRPNAWANKSKKIFQNGSSGGNPSSSFTNRRRRQSWSGDGDEFGGQVMVVERLRRTGAETTVSNQEMPRCSSGVAREAWFGRIWQPSVLVVPWWGRDPSDGSGSGVTLW
ncbi:hypothetical protein V2J09_004208 [Rumex salicifolius]